MTATIFITLIMIPICLATVAGVHHAIVMTNTIANERATKK